MVDSPSLWAMFMPLKGLCSLKNLMSFPNFQPHHVGTSWDPQPPWGSEVPVGSSPTSWHASLHHIFHLFDYRGLIDIENEVQEMGKMLELGEGKLPASTFGLGFRWVFKSRWFIGGFHRYLQGSNGPATNASPWNLSPMKSWS